MKITLIIMAIIIVLFIGYSIWWQIDRVVTTIPVEIAADAYTVYGTNHQHGNLVAIQPMLLTTDFANAQSFYNCLNQYFLSASQKGWFNSKTVAVLPEYLGTWLITAGEKAVVYQAKDLTTAMQIVIFCHPLTFLKELIFAKAKDKVRYSLFKIKAKIAAQIYQQVFSKLAKQYQVTIVAGSIILPNPQLKNNHLIVGKGVLYNVSLIFKPTGLPVNEIVRKVYPTIGEQPFLTAGSLDQLPVFNMPAGRMGVLICADAWYPAAYQVLKAKQVEVIVVPSFCTPAHKLNKLWQGYSGHPLPNDVDLRDIHQITEREAWQKYALAGRIASAGANYGVNVYLRGDFWGLGSDGATVIVDRGKVITEKDNNGAALLNYWLP